MAAIESLNRLSSQENLIKVMVGQGAGYKNDI